MATETVAQRPVPAAPSLAELEGEPAEDGPADPRHPRLRLAVLGGCAAVSLGLYLLLPRVLAYLGPSERSFAEQLFPWVGGLLDGSLLEARGAFDVDLGDYMRLHTWGAAFYLALLLGLFVLYGLALWASAGSRSPSLAGLALVAGAGFLFVQVLSPATLSSDVFSYIIYGRIFLAGGDPYTQVPAQYPEDPFLPYVYWKEAPSFYGPLWTALSGLLAAAGGGDVAFTVLLFRWAAVIAALVGAYLIWACLARAAPDRATQGLILFLWNPLLVIESGLSGHNDAVMAALAVLAIWLYLDRRRSLGLLALTLSALVKFATLPLLPLYVLLVLRRLPGLRQRAAFLATGLAGAALTTALVLGASRSGPEVLAVGALGSGLDRYQNSLHGLAFERLRTLLGQEPEWEGVPVQFEPWWAMTHTSAELWSETEPVGTIEQWTPGIVLAPQQGAWLRFYDTASRRIGYVRAASVGPLAKPPEDIDDEAARLKAGPAASVRVWLANLLVRLFGVIGFGFVWLLAAWRASHLRQFLAWSVALLLAFYWLTATWIWPWYVLWALGLAALIPRSWLAGLTALLSATVLSLYVSHGYQATPEEWIYTYRSLPAFALPLAMFGLSAALWWLLLSTARLLRATARWLRSRALLQRRDLGRDQDGRVHLEQLSG